MCFARWKSQLYYLFIYDYYCIGTDVIVTKPGVLRLIFLFVIMVHEVIEPSGCQRGHQGPDSVGCYLSLSSVDLTNTLSHTYGSWYLPIFLFRDGSLTVISIASLMDLAILWSSLPTMLKFSRERSLQVVLWCAWMGEGKVTRST